MSSGRETEFADPVRILLHVGDVMDGFLGQARAGVAYVSFR